MKEKIKLIYRFIIVIVAAIAIYLNFKLLTFEKGILYFTNISNLLCLIYFSVLIILTLKNKDKKNDIYYIFKGMVTMAITLTMAVYNVILSSNSGMEAFEGHMLECNLVHLIVPLLVILDYIIFGKKGNLKKEYPIIWSAVLILYQIFVIIYISLGGTFLNGDVIPYFYMDINQFGILGVTINLVVLFIVYIGYGYLIVFLDNLIGKNSKKINKLNN